MRWSSVLDYRFWLLSGVFCLAVAGLFQPQLRLEQSRPQLLFVVDITGSMNVRDEERDGQSYSRLDAVRRTLRQTLVGLPCGSRAALAVFSERRAFLLLEPVEVCENVVPLSATIEALNWRMAWEGDSYITKGLESGLQMAQDLGLSLVFLTDGHEAPPLPLAQADMGSTLSQRAIQLRSQAPNRSRPSDAGEGTQTGGLIVGVGGTSPSPIPKFDDTGHQIDFFGADDVEQENRSGPPPANAANREGWHARNAPFGARRATGTEHLSWLKEPHLRMLARAYGLAYTKLADPAALTEAMMANARTHQVITPIPLAPYLAGLACALLVIFYLSACFRRR